nr:DNA translocase FtsK [Listeria floridensis]
MKTQSRLAVQKKRIALINEEVVVSDGSIVNSEETVPEIIAEEKPQPEITYSEETEKNLVEHNSPESDLEDISEPEVTETIDPAIQSNAYPSTVHEFETEADQEEACSTAEEDEQEALETIQNQELAFQTKTEIQKKEWKDTHKKNSAERSESPKSHIPFNVLMVNQDVKEKDKPQNDPMIEKPSAMEISSFSEQSSNQEGNYHFPPLSLLNPPVVSNHDETWLDQQEDLLNETLQNFNVEAHVVGRTQGPAVTRFEVQPQKGVKVSKITNLSDDIKLSLAAKDIRIEAPIPGKSTVGIEIPNQASRPVMLAEIMGQSIFQDNPSPLTAALGLDISGEAIATDLQKMPHGLIAGATGSGKSVCINSLLVSLLYKARPDQLKLLLIDPKMVELAPYNKIPHLVSPVITDAKAATAALKWAVTEMERRYELFAHTGVRNVEKYNEQAGHPDHSGVKLPYILIVIDELADLMMVAPNDVEESISRIAQKARACGIHMIVATQRPSVDVITGLIKANIPTRISFSVSSAIDSRTILDSSGAEKLLGKGDMLFLPSGVSKPVRLQGTYVSDEEIDAVVRHVRLQGDPDYLFLEEDLAKEAVREEEDELFEAACDFVMEQNAASTSLLQRHFRIGYNRAARLMESLERYQIVSATNGSKPRDVIITREQLEKLRSDEPAI